MVSISDDAVKFINDLLEKNGKSGWGIKIYFSGMACSGPQFGMAFQEKAAEGDEVLKMKGLSFFTDDETKKILAPCEIAFVDDPNFGSGLTITDPTAKGCSSCGGGCS
ncbi:MAG: iron-sulfur cluster assembly accessory protein [Thermoplasmatales archaeon]|nr:iron-sulfur cluster assembly accessory protein [Thermoplasmatales archaeon]